MIKLYTPFLVIAVVLGGFFTLNTAEKATENWTKPLTFKEFKKEATKTVEYVYSYNN